ncbi:exosortase A [Sedimenticola selenatireducens]|uniref:exosortase A n=1 Tax=Sedimenticola selenatireducens TaxID=191960 RepID=UPI0009FCB803|nr:exosortase A [Sedimenticola selenatireducens]
MNSQREVYSESSSWPAVLVLTIILIAAILGLFYETAWSMVSIWYRSETFAHGFIIVPITLWLIWEKRSTLRQFVPQPEYRVLLLLVGGGFLWLIGYLADALVIQQLALVSILIFGIWTLLGNQITWALAFPLAFLFFAVPMGEDLVPPLMEITATATVYLIKLTGVPVYREGLFFSLPSGDWSVVEACSGVRYLIASVTLGALYAYMTYNRLSKRALFILAAAIVPIIANSLRAYIIVMLGHLSDMKIATGVDHLVYGWLFFGLVMLILFSIGAIWRDPHQKPNEDVNQADSRRDVKYNRFFAALSIVLLSASVWPILAYAMDNRATLIDDKQLVLPGRLAGWEAASASSDAWLPQFNGASQIVHGQYHNDQQQIGVSIGHYALRNKGAELINSQNLLLEKDERKWRITDSNKVTIQINGRPLEIDQITIKGADQIYQVLTWYRIGDVYTSSRYKAKLLEAFYRLTFGRQDSARVVISIPREIARNDIIDPEQEFLDQLMPALETTLDRLVNNQ